MLTTSHQRGLEESRKLLRTQRQAGADTEPAPNRLIKPTRGVSRQMNLDHVPAGLKERPERGGRLPQPPEGNTEGPGTASSEPLLPDRKSVV